MWRLKLRCSSRVKPKYCIESDLVISESLNLILSGRLFSFDLVDLKMINEDFFAFKVSLFAINHLFICSMMTWPLLEISSAFLALNNTLVSSANILVLPEGQQFGMSLMYIRNNRGPRTDPWGTPQVMDLYDDLWLLSSTNCLRFVK